MSKVNLIYDAYITLLEATLPTYARIPNGLDIAGSSQLLKGYGWAVTPQDGLNTERLIGCEASIQRNFTVSLVNRFTATEHNAVAIDSIYKNLLIDAETLVKAVERSTVLNTTIQGLGTTKYTDDLGIEYLDAERSKFLILEMNFQTEYFVDIKTA